MTVFRKSASTGGKKSGKHHQKTNKTRSPSKPQTTKSKAKKQGAEKKKAAGRH